jgi:tRNA-2-methylthio-N6-dimethylallyladenosine synthase
MKRFALKTFGCQMNKDDSERIAALMTSQGYAHVPEIDQAEVIIYNTCCVRQNADDRAYGQIAALKQLKKDRPELVIAVGGCMAQMDGEELLEKLPHVDVVFGTHNVSRLPQLLKAVIAGDHAACEVVENSTEFTSDLPAERQHEWHAWLPITVGCDNFCTYCIVPYVRGREKSRDPDDLVKEAAGLAADGVEEVTLLGQNVNSYGRDLYGRPAFTELLDRLSIESGLRRIRFTTSHPKDLTEETINIIGQRGNLCPHIHLPLQAGSDRVLALMRRRYTAAHYLKLVRMIKERIPDVSITTDIMVGFPGETEEDFEQTLEVVKTARFDQAFTFIYSTRPGTVAAGYDDPVPAETKSAWFSRLLDMQNQISLERNQAVVGSRVDVFVEGLSKKDRHRLAARTPSNKLVHFNGSDRLIGQTVPVAITEAYSWFILGEEVNE